MTKTHILCLLMILRMLRIIILHLPVNQGGLKETTNKVLEDEAKLVTDIVGLL